MRTEFRCEIFDPKKMRRENICRTFNGLYSWDIDHAQRRGPLFVQVGRVFFVSYLFRTEVQNPMVEEHPNVTLGDLSILGPLESEFTFVQRLANHISHHRTHSVPNYALRGKRRRSRLG